MLRVYLIDFSKSDMKNKYSRLRRTVFEYLLNVIGPQFTTDNLEAGNDQIDSTKQLLITLWFLATPDSYR